MGEERGEREMPLSGVWALLLRRSFSCCAAQGEVVPRWCRAGAAVVTIWPAEVPGGDQLVTGLVTGLVIGHWCDAMTELRDVW